MSRPQGESPLPSDEVEAVVAARRELEGELEPHLIEGFLDRVGKSIDARVDERLAGRGRSSREDRDAQNRAIGVLLGSLGIGIPLTGAAGGTAGISGILVVWIGIVVVNVAYTLGHRRR